MPTSTPTTFRGISRCFGWGAMEVSAGASSRLPILTGRQVAQQKLDDATAPAEIAGVPTEDLRETQFALHRTNLDLAAHEVGRRQIELSVHVVGCVFPDRRT